MSDPSRKVAHPFGPESAIEVRGGVHLDPLDRPDSLHAVDIPMHRALEGVWRFLGDDPTVQAVVVTGRGRALSVGSSLDHHVDLHRDAPAAECQSFDTDEHQAKSQELHIRIGRVAG